MVALLLLSFSVFSQSALDKIDTELLAEAQVGVNTEFIIVLEEKADFSKAYLLKNKVDKTNYVHQQLLETARRSQTNVIATLDGMDTPYRSFIIANCLWAVGDLKVMQTIADLPEVRRVQFNSIFVAPVLAEEGESANGGEVDPREPEYGLTMIEADKLWAMGFTGQGTVVSGGDTGYEWDHPSLKPNYRGWDGENVDHNFNWSDGVFLDDPTAPCGFNSPDPCDSNSHGTHTMGTMAGRPTPDGKNIGVAPDAQWIGCRNSLDSGLGTMETFMACFEWTLKPFAIGSSTENGDATKTPHVNNNSWGCGEGCTVANWQPMIDVIDAMKAAGIVVVASAGNYDQGGNVCQTVVFPAGIFANTFTVGSVDPDMGASSFSSRGPVAVDGSLRMKPDVAAPGRNTLSTVLDGEYDTKSGTSMAGPHVAGAVALLISAAPSFEGNVEAIENALKNTAMPQFTKEGCGGDTEATVPNNTYGHGIINVFEAAKIMRQEALAAELIDFHGLMNKNQAELHWTVSDNSDTEAFIIQRSKDLNNWQNIGEVTSKMNTSAAQKYTFTDVNPQKGTNYYRLLQTSKSGKNELSKAIVLEYNGEVSSVATLYPNPSSGLVNIRLNNEIITPQSQLEILVFNSLGQLTQRSPLVTDNEQLNLANGMHFYTILNVQGRVVQDGKLVIK